MEFRKFSVFTILFLVTNLTIAQGRGADFHRIDWNVQFIQASAPEVLAQKLTSSYSTDLEKVRSIFRWITEHIEYNTLIYNRYSRSSKKLFFDDDDDTSTVLKPLNERVAATVLKRKLAVCDGYARLFKSLCDFAGIKSEIITGYARTDSENNTSFRSNHTWNAVFIDSNWYLLDVTWASGYLSFWGNEYVRKYNDFYFLTDPKEFIKDHYPEDLQWTLLDDPPTLREYNQSPFKHSSFIKYKITSFKPAVGIIEAAVGDTLQLELLVRDLDVGSSLEHKFFIDSISQNQRKMAFIEPHSTSKQKIVFQYIVQPTVYWLHLVHDENIILRYRIKMKEAVAVNH
jgi:hypothetical protein